MQGGAGEFVRAIDTSPRLSKLINWGLDYPQREVLLGLARALLPIVSVGGWVIVFRDEDVREVLANDEAFAVPWGGKMKDVTGGRNFVLGMKNDDEYRMNYRQLAHAFPREDVPRQLDAMALRVAQQLLQGRTRIDAVRELMWGVPARLCDEYYGIEMPDPLQVADWSVVMSSYLFSLPGAIDEVPPADDHGRKLATEAANGFRALIRRSIGKAKAGQGHGVVLPRLIDMQRQNFPGLADEVIEAHLFGMVTGFIPTNLLAGGNILETLLRHPDFMERARAAALAGDDRLLWRCLQEALRFRFFNPGPFRVCAKDATIAAGTRRETRVAAGSRMMIMTPSAMFDPRRVKNPHRFDPGRPADDYLVFGYGQHWCLGAYIAISQLTQTFKALLTREGLRRAPGKDGRLQYITVYPAHLCVEYRV